MRGCATNPSSTGTRPVGSRRADPTTPGPFRCTPANGFTGGAGKRAPAWCVMPFLLVAVVVATGCATRTLTSGAGSGETRVEVGVLTGLVVESIPTEAGPERDLRIHVGGELAVDARDYDRRNVRDDQVRLDRARLRVDGTYDALAWRVTGDLIGVDTRGGFEEAWASWSPDRRLRVTVGLWRAALGIEESVRTFDLAFVGPALPAYLGGRTDLTVGVDGELHEGLLSYEATFGAGEGFDAFGQRRAHPQVSLKLTSYPLRHVDLQATVLGYEGVPLLAGLFVSGAYAWTPRFEGYLDVATDLRNKLFSTPRLEARDGSRFLYVGYGADFGPFRWLHETAIGSLLDLETPSGPDDLDDQITAWAASLSWMLSGEHYDSRPHRQRDGRDRTFPARPWVPLTPDGPRGYGAVEVAARYANGDIDRDFFNLGVTDFTVSSQEFRTFTAAVNWYPIWNLRCSAEVVRVIADQFPGVFRSHGRDTSFIFQVQVRF